MDEERPRRRMLDEEDEEEQQEQEEEQPKARVVKREDWTRLVNLAGSVAGLTAITILSFEVAVGPIRLGRILAYVAGSLILIGILLLLVVAFRWAVGKIGPGMGRYIFWAFSLPFALFYYLIFAFIVYGYLVRSLIVFMEVILDNAP